MRRKQIFTIGLAAALTLSLFMASGLIFAGPTVEEEIYLVRVSSPRDIDLIRNMGGNILYRYPDFALVELDEAGVTGLSSSGMPVNQMRHRTVVNVKGWSFDIHEGPSGISSDMMLDGYPSGTYGLYIVHMIGPVSGEWLKELEGIGVDMINYIPNYAFEVRMTPEQASEVEKLDFIDWVGVYQPAFKLAPDLRPGPVTIRLVDGFHTGTLHTIADEIDIMWATELATYGTQIMAEVHDMKVLHELARMPDVYHISNYYEEVQADEMATQITGGGLWIWDPEDNPDVAYRGHGEYGSLANQLGYKGSGVVIAVGDGGIGDGTVGDAGHPDFTGRVIGGYSFREGDPSWADHDDHGTHCAGSAAGDTYHGTGAMIQDSNYYAAQGSAPQSELFAVKVFHAASWCGPEDRYEILEAAAQHSDTYVHTNSWGAMNVNGAYDFRSEAFDKGVRDADRSTGHNVPMVVFAAAGNEGYDGDNTLRSPATGKNVIAVGATQSYIPGSRGGGDPDLTSIMSSRGWTDDNRIKPDIMAPGENICSTVTGGGYSWETGTSMSTPAAAGAGAVVVEWYETYHGYRPSPAMVRALLINTAYNLQGQYEGNIPTNREGWGMVNLPALVYADSGFVTYDQEYLLATGQTREHMVQVEDMSEPLKITLTWTDKEALDGDLWTLKNDLNLEIVSPGGDVYRGNAFSSNEGEESDTGYTFPNVGSMAPFDTDGDGWDDVNNVQCVYIHPDDLEEGTYTIRVIGANIPADANNDGQPNQDYALVVYNGKDDVPGTPPDITLSRPQGGEVFTAGSVEDITWSASPGDDPVDSITLHYSIDGGGGWETIAEGMPNSGSHSWTVPNHHSTQCLIRAQVRDVLGRTSEDISGLFTIEGTPPSPPSNLVVEHYGTAEGVTNGQFIGGYEPWSLTREYDDGEAGWDQESYMEGGSIYVTAEAEGEGVISREDAYWEQDITPTSEEVMVSGAFRKDLDYGSGFRWETFVHHAVAEISLHDTVTGWQVIHQDLDNSFGDSGWTVLEPTDYVPQGYVNAVRVRMMVEAEGDTGPQGGTRKATGSIWMDHISVIAHGMEGTEDNRISWDASPHEAEVSHYNIYRADGDTGPWSTPLAAVPADGSIAYHHIDPGTGTGDDILWWYVIRSVGVNGVEEQNTHAVPEPILDLESFHIDLHTHSGGWNFVSFNLVPLDNSLESILEDGEYGVSGNYDRVIYFDSGSGDWLSHVPGRPDHFNNLGTWNNRMGIWIRMIQEDMLTVRGVTPTTTSLELHPGWNMIGLPSITAGNHDLPEEVDMVGYFDTTSDHNIAYTTAAGFQFQPGKGYWLYNRGEDPVIWKVHY